jgi:hypothetical protein
VAGEVAPIRTAAAGMVLARRVLQGPAEAIRPTGADDQDLQKEPVSRIRPVSIGDELSLLRSKQLLILGSQPKATDERPRT